VPLRPGCRPQPGWPTPGSLLNEGLPGAFSDPEVFLRSRPEQGPVSYGTPAGWLTFGPQRTVSGGWLSRRRQLRDVIRAALAHVAPSRRPPSESEALIARRRDGGRPAGTTAAPLEPAAVAAR
jgi:hypothetical protein